MSALSNALSGAWEWGSTGGPGYNTDRELYAAPCSFPTCAGIDPRWGQKKNLSSLSYYKQCVGDPHCGQLGLNVLNNVRLKKNGVDISVHF